LFYFYSTRILSSPRRGLCMFNGDKTVETHGLPALQKSKVRERTLKSLKNTL
jgi:hypothetical protein